MRRFYRLLANKLNFFPWGRAMVGHVRRHYRFYENFEALYTALILALIIKSFVFEAYKIPSSSMLDTLQIGDRIFVNKFVYEFWPVEVGDIVVFKTKGISEIYDPEKPYFIKRVVGLPGDELQILPDGHLSRNGEIIDDPEFFLENRYKPMMRNNKNTFIVPENEVYVFGDNSWNSDDSRRWGGVPIENIMGKAFFRYWPLTRIGGIEGVPPENVRERVGDSSVANRDDGKRRAHASEP